MIEPIPLNGISRAARRTPLLVASAILVLALVTFGPIYWLRLSHNDPNLTSLVQGHGALMFAWLALLVTQTVLIRGERFALHRNLGYCGAVIAAGVVIVGTLVLVHGAERHANGDPYRFRVMLIAFDGANLVAFLGLVAFGIALRRQSATHRRLMLLATLGLLGPSFGRLTSILNGFGEDNDLAVWLLMLSALAVFGVGDYFISRRLRASTLYGIVVLAMADTATYVAKLAV